MKTSTYKFRDQVNAVTEYFKSWNECEQTVALYSLMRILNPTQAKFLMQVIEHGSAADPADIQIAQRNANDPGMLIRIYSPQYRIELFRLDTQELLKNANSCSPETILN